MKQIITFIAILPILLIMIMQPIQTTINKSYTNQVLYYTELAETQAIKDGYFSDGNIRQLKENISAATGISTDEITVSATGADNKKTRMVTYDESNLIVYRVEVPLETLMAGATFFGIKASDNRGLIVIDRKVASEALPS